MGRYIFLHSGRPLPGDQERASRNEGVGIALDEKATLAWKNAGEVWEAVSSRIISARLKWVHRKEKGRMIWKCIRHLCISSVCLRTHS